jgi:hypothetical protein
MASSKSEFIQRRILTTEQEHFKSTSMCSPINQICTEAPKPFEILSKVDKNCMNILSRTCSLSLRNISPSSIETFCLARQINPLQGLAFSGFQNLIYIHLLELPSSRICCS